VPPPEQDDDAFTPTGPALGADGKLERPASAPLRTPHTSALRPPRAASPATPEVLELAERPRPAPTDYVPPPPPPEAHPPSRAPLSLFALLLLAGLAAGGWFAWGYWRTTHPTPAALVFINSEPSGATVRLGGTEVGTTPWAADNAWGPGPVQVEVSRPGYRTWTGSFAGGGPAHLNVRLQKR
jgi:hypothetical protein